MSSFFLRGIGAVCLVVCGWCVGDSVCARAQAHQAALQETAELLERIQTEISFRRTDLNRMLASLKRDGFVREEERSLQNLEPSPFLTRREQACFRDCFSGLGHTEAEQECQRLTLYIKQFEAFQETLRPHRKDETMEIDLIFKIAAIGIIVAVLNQLLIRSGREDQAMMTTLAGLVVVLSILVKQISALFVTIQSLFSL